MNTSLFKRFVTVSGLTGLLAGAWASAGLFGTAHSARAGQAGAAPSIFQGSPAQSTGLTLSSWGSGSITEDQKNVYAGTESLRIVTHGQFQGADLRLGKPVDLGRFVGDKSSYLQFAVYLPPTDKTASPGPGPGFGAGFGGKGFGVPPGSGGPAGSGGPGSGATTGGTTKPKSIENLRVVLVRPTGKPLELLLPLANAVQDTTWKLLNIPVQSLPGITAENAKFSEIRLFGDNPGVLYVGRIGLVNDSTPIKVETVNDMIVEIRKPYRYIGSATGGAAPLKYSWDWDDKDGIQEESIGKSVVHTYYREGDMVGTLTVSDVYGLKAPVTTKFKVHIHN